MCVTRTSTEWNTYKEKSALKEAWVVFNLNPCLFKTVISEFLRASKITMHLPY